MLKPYVTEQKYCLLLRHRVCVCVCVELELPCTYVPVCLYLPLPRERRREERYIGDPATSRGSESVYEDDNFGSRNPSEAGVARVASLRARKPLNKPRGNVIVSND